jgi:adenine phosphoribosyltransferase
MGSHADELRVRLQEAFRWAEVEANAVSDLSGWWRDRTLLAELGPALAELFPDVTPTVVLGPEASGFLVGPLVAWELGAGFVEAYRDSDRMIADETLARTATVDERGRSMTLRVRSRHLGPDDQVLVVDDWAESGAQLAALRDLVREAGATYLGAAVIVNGCDRHTRDELTVRGLLERGDLG